MQVTALSAGAVPLAFQAGTGALQPKPTVAQTAADAFGLSFESLLQIILTQLTYQDPLKPMDNFQFVSQLAQFSQIQQGQTMTEKMQELVTAQTTTQAVSLLGRIVDLPTSNPNVSISGTVRAVAFQNGDSRLTIQTPDGQTISNIAPTSIGQVRGAN